jgi:hypothetical protein
MIIRVYIFNITKYHDRDMLNKYLSVSPNVVLYKYNYGIIFFWNRDNAQGSASIDALDFDMLKI